METKKVNQAQTSVEMWSLLKSMETLTYLALRGTLGEEAQAEAHTLGLFDENLEKVTNFLLSPEWALFAEEQDDSVK